MVKYVSKVSGLTLTKNWCVSVDCCKVKCIELHLMGNLVLGTVDG